MTKSGWVLRFDQTPAIGCPGAGGRNGSARLLVLTGSCASKGRANDWGRFVDKPRYKAETHGKKCQAATPKHLNFEDLNPKPNLNPTPPVQTRQP